MQHVFRFAPSPNGLLHLGHAFSALLNAELAARSDGRMLLRIEDIDPARSRPDFEAAIRDDLAWLGIRFEEPVRRQSEHLPLYAEAAEALRRRGLLYPCLCSRGDIRAAIGEDRLATWPRDPDGAPVYPGTCRVGPGHDAARRRHAAGEPAALRFAMDEALAQAGGFAEWTVFDPADRAESRVAGDARAWGDVVIARKDVATSYHLCVVVDDALQGVTHVVRGRDLEPSTAIHRVLQQLLGMPAPRYHHHALVLDEEGAKLAKRAGSTPLRQLREEGETPASIRRRLGFSA
jgi:glutamyl-Q tRNA(Asp) synthetase